MLEAPRLQRLIEVGRDLVSHLDDLDEVLARLLQTAREVTGAHYAAVGVLDEQRARLARFLTSGIEEDRRREIGDLPHGRGVLGLLITDPAPLRLDDVSAHAESYGFPPGHPPMTTFLGVPVLIRGEAWGNLYLTEKPGGFDADDEEAARVLAAWTAIAVENARLYTSAEGRRQELERAIRGFEATASIARAVGGETDLGRVLELITKRGRALVEARAVVILLLEGEELVIAAAAGEGVRALGGRTSVGGALLHEALTQRRPRRVEDLERDLGVAPHALGVDRARSALLVPLVYRGQGVGLLVAFDRLLGTGAFTPDDEEVFRAFAASAATAVATAQTVEADRLRRSLEAAEAERRRWARELHDETLQGLAGLKVILGSVGRVDGVPDTARGAIDTAIEHVGAEIDNLRAIVNDLRPAALDELGLVPALTSLAQRTGVRAGLEMETELPEDQGARLPPTVETTIYRLAQEALTNVVKHAGATRAELALRLTPGAAELTVADDGQGFDPHEPTEGFGLVGMRERVELAGGSLSVERRDGRTLVHARVPVRG